MDKLEYALRYPFERLPQSYVLLPSGPATLMSLNVDDVDESQVEINGAVRRLGDVRGDPQQPLRRMVPVLVAGSNASPSHLTAKLKGRLARYVVPVVRCTVRDFVSVFSAHFTSYGSIAATIQHLAGAEFDTHMLLLEPRSLEILHETEHLGQHYWFAELMDVSVQSEFGTTWKNCYFYLTINGCLSNEGVCYLVKDLAARGCTWPVRTQSEILHLAQSLTRFKGDLRKLVEKITSDPGFRTMMTSRLSKFSVEFSYPHHRIER